MLSQLAGSKVKRVSGAAELQRYFALRSGKEDVDDYRRVIKKLRSIINEEGDDDYSLREVQEFLALVFFFIIGHRGTGFPSDLFLEKRAKWLSVILTTQDTTLLLALLHVFMLTYFTKEQGLTQYKDEVEGLTEYLTGELKKRYEAE